MKNQLLLILVVFWLGSCNNEDNIKEVRAVKDTTIRISVDESFEPIMREQLKVYAVAYPDTKVIASYKSEAECLRDLQNDSTKIVIISRELTKLETQFYDNKIGFRPAFEKLAKDAIGVIVNVNSKDSVFTMEELKMMLSGKSKSDLKVALDGKNATSTVRYLNDSLLKGKPFGPNISGANSSEDLINYIASSDDAVGFVGISWVTNPKNKQQEVALKNVKLALVECSMNCEKGSFARPSQQTITFGQYPLVRGLYYVLKENYAGLASRLVQFLTTERGQLIFRRALLVPAKINFDRRRTQIKMSK